jgi:osmotically-inducible protein OsmY
MINGVVAVDNRIEVERPLIVPDRELHDSVTKVLDWTPDLDSSDIGVSALEGVVTLRGTVRHYWQKLRAHLLAARVQGVVHVVDELAVTPAEQVSDREIADRLTQALERRLLEDTQMIQLTVNEGVVTLRGAVPNAAAFQAAQKAAERTQGVVAVRNELKFPAGAKINRVSRD